MYIDVRCLLGYQVSQQALSVRSRQLALMGKGSCKGGQRAHAGRKKLILRKTGLRCVKSFYAYRTLLGLETPGEDRELFRAPVHFLAIVSFAFLATPSTSGRRHSGKRKLLRLLLWPWPLRRWLPS